MSTDATPTDWVKKFEDECYTRFSAAAREGGCRPATLIGIMQCTRMVVRDGRCLLHMPKPTKAEKQLLDPVQRIREEALEREFATEIQKMQIADFSAIHFPALEWNQPPYSALLNRGGTVSFNKAVFYQPVNMTGVTFGSSPSFIKTVFRDDVNFAVAAFTSGAIFQETVFEKLARFHGCSFEAQTSFTRTYFLGRADFNLAKVSGILRFVGTDDNTLFKDVADFSRLEIGEKGSVVFELACLARASFLYSDLEKMNFRTVEWCGDGRRPFIGTGRARLSDETLLNHVDANLRDCEAVGENYRQLVLKYEKRRDFEKAEEFHIGEMEVRRYSASCVSEASLIRKLRRGLNPFLIYRFLSYYGSSYWRAALILFGFVLLASAGFMIFGLRPTEGQVGLREVRYVLAPCFCLPPLKDLTVDFRSSLTHVLSILTFQREKAFEPASLSAQAWQALSSIILTGQGALVLLAIRRRFKR